MLYLEEVWISKLNTENRVKKAKAAESFVFPIILYWFIYFSLIPWNEKNKNNKT